MHRIQLPAQGKLPHRLNNLDRGELNICVRIMEFDRGTSLQGRNFPWTTRGIPFLKLLWLGDRMPDALSGSADQNTPFDSYVFHIYTTAASTDWMGGRKSAMRSQLSPESRL